MSASTSISSIRPLRRAPARPRWAGRRRFEAIQCVRALRGLDLIGADLVEVSPPFDTGGITAWLGASVMFELICAMQPE